MSRTGEYFLEMAERNNWIEADKYYEELKNDEYECPHKTVIMTKSNVNQYWFVKIAVKM